MNIRKSAERGHAQHGWLESRHTFSFANYYDPAHMGFRDLRVINEDRVIGGAGFPTHPHRDMEIVSIVLDGAIEHRDSMGNGSVIRPGDVQRMTAGTGVTHSEFNPSPDEPLHFLQIWIQPERRGLEPSYEQTRFDEDAQRNRWCLVGSRDGRDGSVTIHQDVSLHLSRLDAGASITHELAGDRHAWLQVIDGAVTLDGEALETGDGVAISGRDALTIEATAESHLLLFDLA